MRILKNILIGTGVLFLVLIGLFAWVKSSSDQFRKEEAPFVEAFVSDLSKRWDLADVYDRLAPPFIEQVGTPQTQQLQQKFRRLGRLKSVFDLELQRYNAYNLTQSGLFSFKAIFENGDALASVTLIRNDGVVRVQGFYLRGIQMRQGSSKLQT